MDDKERERRRKISAAKTGSKHSDETKAKIAQTLSGRRVSASARSNMGAAATGRKFSRPTRTQSQKVNVAVMPKTNRRTNRELLLSYLSAFRT